MGMKHLLLLILALAAGQDKSAEVHINSVETEVVLEWSGSK
jgi:hypothetical protein